MTFLDWQASPYEPWTGRDYFELLVSLYYTKAKLAPTEESTFASWPPCLMVVSQHYIQLYWCPLGHRTLNVDSPL